MVKSAHKKNFFVPGGASVLVKKFEEELEEDPS
jgi:hypothetical protein